MFPQHDNLTRILCAYHVILHSNYTPTEFVAKNFEERLKYIWLYYKIVIPLLLKYNCKHNRDEIEGANKDIGITWLSI